MPPVVSSQSVLTQLPTDHQQLLMADVRKQRQVLPLIL